jgi:hypothetical protein
MTFPVVNGTPVVESAVYWNVARTLPSASLAYECGWLNPATSSKDVRIVGVLGLETSKSHVRPAWNPFARRCPFGATTSSV